MADRSVRRSAIISGCGLYRYELRRIWNDRLAPYVSGMLNPSTADAEIDDQTITRNWRRANALGCGSLIVWNLGAGRATDPDDWKAMTDPIGPENDTYIRRILIECRDRNGIAVVGWGGHGSFMGRDRAVLKIAAEVGINFYCLGTNKNGQPKHPLYVAYRRSLIEWKGSVVENVRIACPQRSLLVCSESNFSMINGIISTSCRLGFIYGGETQFSCFGLPTSIAIYMKQNRVTNKFPPTK